MARQKSTAPKDSAAHLGFEARLWLAADKLRNNMDAAEYKHVVLGLIFLKYISDSFEEHHAKLTAEKGELVRFDINSMDSASGIPSTSRDDFYGIPVIVPPPEIQDVFGKIVAGWFAKIFANESRSHTLATLRDTLLPKLLSGELATRALRGTI